MWPSWRAWVARNQAPPSPFHDRTYRSSPARTTQIVTALLSVPSRRSDASSSSSAAAILCSSSLVHLAIGRPPTDGFVIVFPSAGIAFRERGEHVLKGLPGEWSLFVVTAAA